MKTILLLTVISTLYSAIRFSEYNYTELGTASYYADFFEGRITANGEVFSQSKFTAAHRTLPFGTEVRVENTANGKSIVVVINDRGPFVNNRVIDLSRSAAKELGMIQSGIQKVELKANIDLTLVLNK